MHSAHRALRLLFCISVLSSGSLFAATIQPRGDFVPREVLIRIELNASSADVQGMEHAADIDQSERVLKLKSGEIWRMRSRSKNPDAIKKALEKNPRVVYVEPNYILHALATPDDPSYGQLWGLRNTGQMISGVAGLAGADIDAEPAWNLTTGSASVVVGVIDTGVDYNHPDLAANMWSNPGGIGHPDCAAGTHGFNAINRTCDPMDDYSHGTHVAGTIGAAGNNAAGVTGVNWTTSIMALKFISSFGTGTTADAIAAIEFAVQAKIAGVNVRVLSNSWGGGSFSKSLLDAINRANDNDILFVASAGNDGYNTDVFAHYPSSYGTLNMISVAATDNRDRLSYFSNFGLASVHLGAPGVSILSTRPSDSYGFLSGTSMAAPHVSGVAALVLSHSPSLTTAQVKSAILDNVDPVDSLTGKTVTGGRLNAARALGIPAGPDFAMSVSPASRTAVRGTAASYSLTITPSGGFGGSVTLSASGVPSNATATFTPNPATSFSTLTVTTSDTTPLGTQSISVIGTSAEPAHEKFVTLTTVASLPVAACPEFSLQQKYTLGYDPTAVATGDFNRDGKPDLAVAITASNRIAVYLGNGSGGFQSVVQYPVGTAPLSVAVGDFNGDGRADLVSANSGSHNVSIRLGNGDGTFQAPVVFDAGTNPFWVAAGDFDADGNTDLAVVNNGSSNVSILLGDGDGTFQPPAHYATGSGSFWVAIGDLDRDGALDLVIAAHNADQVSVLLGNGDGTFQAAVTYAAGDRPSSVAIADFNGDGSDDLAVTNFGSGNVSVLSGNGDGTFQTPVNHAAGNGPYALAVLDANADGITDLVVANSTSNNLSLLLGAGDGTFLTAISYATGYNPNHVAVVDLNGDGRPDLAVPNVDSGSLWIWLNTGICSMNCGTFEGAAAHSAGISPESAATGDFNRDGQADLVVANYGSNTVSVAFGNGDGTFEVAVDYGTGSGPASVNAADLNGDGNLDLLVANAGSDNVSILLGTPNGIFQGASHYATGDEPHSVAFDDFDGDGRLDLAVANYSSDDVSILLGNGDGTFQVAVHYAAGSNPSGVTVGDLNRDGRADVVVANAGSNDVSLLRGKGDGTFHTAASFNAGTSPSAVVIADLNRDGKPDLAVTNSGSNDVSVLLGNGDGTVGAAVNYLAAGTTPRSIAAGDFNDDGVVDLAVANQGSNDVSLLAGLGNGTFAAATSRAAGTSPYGLAVGDFNRDDKVDLAVANRGSNDISVLLNTCPVPDLTVTKSHSGSFTQGDTGKTYPITVTNSGAGPTDGAVSVRDTLPIGLSATAMTGSGWTCDHLTSTCSRNDVLAGGSSYPAITLTVKVANNAATSVTNLVTIFGGGELNTSNNTASDPTTIVPATDIVITKSHSGSFAQGTTGRIYSIKVRNAGGLATSGMVTVTDTLPIGLTATGISGTGWSCTLGTLTCTRNDVLGASSNYPEIRVTVSVAANAPTQVVNVASVSGGGDSNSTNNTASDPTTVWSSETCGGYGMPVTYPVPSEPFAVVTGDFNSDGHADLASTTPYSSNLTVLLGNGDGTFAAGVPHAAGSYPREIIVTDLNNDGDDDLAVVNSNGISILLGNGDGTFAIAVGYSNDNSPISVAAADFDGDGNIDLAVTLDDPGTVGIYLGMGNGALHPPVSYNSGSYPRAIVAADLDGDGKVDVTVTNYYSGSLSILRGNGDGTFQAPISHAASSNSNALAVSDLNMDGKLDLVVSRDYSSYITVLIGNGDATFAGVTYYTVSSSSNSSAVIEDLNGDGIPDLAVSGYSSIGFLFGNGDGTFGAVSHHSLGNTYAGRFSVGDFDGDGKPDLAVAGRYYSTVSVLLGGCSDLTIAKTHEGNFRGGQTGARYTLKVSNVGPASSLGLVTVTDELPSGLTATSMYGYPWSCTLATLTCTTTDSIAPGASHADIQLYVSVSNSAPTSVVNTATVSGGGDSNPANNSASDPTTIVQGPDPSIAVYQAGLFYRGQTGATYSVYVTNSGNQTTSGTITVVDTVPAGLTPTAMSGTGWNCTLATRTCTRSDALSADTSYPVIILTVNVASDCPDIVTNVATVSGGGDVATDNNTATSPTPVSTPPSNLVATAISTSQVSLTWTPGTHTSYFEILRSSNGGPFSYVGYSYTNSYVNGSLTAGVSYLYRVRAGYYSNSPLSNIDVATTVLFTDDPIQPGVTALKSVHLTELRNAVNAVRKSASLPDAACTDPTLTSSTTVKAIHFTELRAALNAARSAIGLPTIVYTDPVLSPGIAVKADHIGQLRLGVQ